MISVMYWVEIAESRIPLRVGARQLAHMSSSCNMARASRPAPLDQTLVRIRKRYESFHEVRSSVQSMKRFSGLKLITLMNTDSNSTVIFQ